jgi:hypothetical protein
MTKPLFTHNKPKPQQKIRFLPLHSPASSTLSCIQKLCQFSGHALGMHTSQNVLKSTAATKALILPFSATSVTVRLSPPFREFQTFFHVCLYRHNPLVSFPSPMHVFFFELFNSSLLIWGFVFRRLVD